MTPADADRHGSARGRSSRLDAIGRLQLAGFVLSVTAACGFLGVRPVGEARGDHTRSATDWLIALGFGLALGLAGAIYQYRTWRRRGGQPLARLARHIWRTATLPETLPLRFAVLREFERRDRDLDRHMPTIVLGIVWTIVFGLQVAMRHTAVDVVGSLFSWGFFIALTVRDVVDRRRWPTLRRLIGELREHPVQVSEAVR